MRNVPGSASGDAHEPIPDRRGGEIYGVDARPPAKQRTGWRHFGAGTEQSDVDIAEVEPIGVVQHQM